jgi:mono/diheme cytochrome c family protein
MGGANWPPSSYDPDTHLLYVCASDRINAFSVDENLAEPAANQVYMGGRFVQSQADDRGIFAALDLTTNRIAWRQQWREICYSGSVVTAGGLLFVGRSDGRLTALDKDNGALLWEFQTDAGVNTAVTTFTHDGEQYVVVHAGGGVFANAQRGDGIWMFSLRGTMRSLPMAGSGPGGPPFGRQAPVDDRPGNAALGKALYLEACVACHGEAGDGGHGGGPTLVDDPSTEEIAAISSAGRNTMPGFSSVYTPAELRDIGSYVVEVLAGE